MRRGERRSVVVRYHSTRPRNSTRCPRSRTKDSSLILVLLLLAGLSARVCNCCLKSVAGLSALAGPGDLLPRVLSLAANAFRTHESG
eukprot:752454-Hanusia_phi.AAC.3